MSYVIYNLETTRFVRILRNGYWQDASYKTEGAARAAFNRFAKDYPQKWVKENSRYGQKPPRAEDAPDFAKTHAIAERAHFHAHIEKQETKRNLLSGKEFTQPVNTPLACDPSSETYWSM
jgi:hypothetical protein